MTSRALSLFSAFDERHRELTLTELAERAALPVPTAFRLVRDLVAWGALERRASGGYVVGRRMWDVGLLAPARAELRQLASPFLHDLYGATFATVQLAERDGSCALYLDRLWGHSSVPVVNTVGTRLPLHATGVGKVLLAHAPPDVQSAVLGELTRITPYTITQPGRLRTQLDRARRDGFTQTNEEMSLGACSVAVPILDHAGAVVASLGVVVPSLKRNRPTLLAGLHVAARGISRSLATFTE